MGKEGREREGGREGEREGTLENKRKTNLFVTLY